ncbi:MAG: cytochrome C [Rhodocyclaceae bacterium]|nr:cytochrome C [Rhodocyclaceae bacterium]
MKTAILALLLGLSLPALADRMPLPADTPASYKAECGSCHLAFPPALLSAGDWQRTLAGLKSHFGTDASVEGRNSQEIAAFLRRHAGDAGRLGSAGDPPRITQTARFSHKHREVPARFWSDPRVKTAANCEGCHRGAAEGRYSEHDLAIPGLHG